MIGFIIVIALTVTSGYTIPVKDFAALSDDINELHVRHARDARDPIFARIAPGIPSGVQATVGVDGTLFNSNGHRLDGQADVTRNFHPSGDPNVHGALQYQGPRTGATLDVNHARSYGTDVAASVNHNLWQQGTNRLDANANYGRHFGGPFGASPPNYGVGLNFMHRF